ncbi:MAG: SMODS domain-containing nucleotidyltransferase [Armatimonadota bacterium]
MGVAEWFSSFCSNIVVNNADSASISLRYRAITKRLNTDFWATTSETSHSLYVGSYGRSTAIKGFSDLDMLFQLPTALKAQYNAYKRNGQSALLQAVKQSMQKTYSTSDVGADGQVIVVHFKDGITFEVVPAFENTDGSFTHPDANSGGSWRTTNPRPEINAIRERNIACNNNLVPLCKMMRAWKNKWNVPIGGLLIDTLAYQFINNWLYKDKSYFYYDYMSRDFFEFMSGQNSTQTYWLAPGSGQYVWKIGAFQSKASQCHTFALSAIQCDSDKKYWSAQQKWREIFGTAFPE